VTISTVGPGPKDRSVPRSSSPVRPLNIAVADDEREMREYLQELLGRQGHQVAAVGTGRQLVELCKAALPDLVITDIKMPDLDGIEAALEVNESAEVPFILISAHHDAELLRRAGAAHVMAYLAKPVKQADVETAIQIALARSEQFRAVRQEARNLAQALEDRKHIERARGAIMKRLQLDENEAFRRLRKYASNHNLKLADFAQQVLRAEELFQGLEAT
jgi:two-component system, response regulator PdtaR